MVYTRSRSPLFQWMVVVLLVMVFGICGFMLVEHYSFFDALYMVVITISTIGYHEVHPLSQAGRAFNIVFILTSFFTFTYLIASITRFIVSGEMAYYFTQKRLMQAMEKMNEHVIVCGYGRNGQQAAQTLKGHKHRFVVIEMNEDAVKQHAKSNPSLVYLVGDATQDDVLLQAGIERASAIIVSLPDDADNVFIVLSARSISANIRIISRASTQSASVKLYKAGADSVVMPDVIGGTHMATLVSKPDVIEFIEYLSGEDGEAIHIETIGYSKLPMNIRDKSLQEIMDWKKTGVNCIGIKDHEGKFCINPPSDTIIAKGMKVIVLGTRDQIAEMKRNVGE